MLLLGTLAIVLSSTRTVGAAAEVNFGRFHHLRIAKVCGGLPSVSWLPTGEPTSILRENKDMDGVPAAERYVVFTFIVSPGARYWPPMALRLPPSEDNIESKNYGGFYEVQSLYKNRDAYSSGFPFIPKGNPRKGDVALGIADGPWHVISRTTFKAGQITKRFGIPVSATRTMTFKDAPGHSQLMVRFAFPQRMKREGFIVYAYDRQGEPLVSAAWSDGSPESREYAFVGSVEKLGRVEIKASPYRWTTFKAVSLTPSDSR